MNKKQLAKETVEYYQVNDRAIVNINDSHECCYRTPTTGAMCGIGRLMTDDALELFGDVMASIKTLGEEHGFSKREHLLPQYQGVSMESLKQIQTLHDSDAFWHHEGYELTEEGKLYVKERFKLTIS